MTDAQFQRNANHLSDGEIYRKAAELINKTDIKDETVAIDKFTRPYRILNSVRYLCRFGEVYDTKEQRVLALLLMAAIVESE